MPNLPPLRTVRESASATPRRAEEPPPPAPAPEPEPAEAPAAGNTPTTAAPTGRLPSGAAAMLAELQAANLLDRRAAEVLAHKAKDRLHQLTKPERVLAALVHYGLLTEYQRKRVESGNTFGLAVGSYRVLDRLNGGTVGVVFLAEHVVLKRRAAVKVLPVDETTPPDRVARLWTEVELLARCAHPHIVGVYDAGILPSPSEWQPALHYVVMELVSGGDLEQYIYANGVQPVAVGCEWARQAATALAATHAQDFVHRDLKPSNMLLTPDGRIKLTDFGLARHMASTLTPRPGMLGTLDFMPPEQTVDPATTGPAADVYALGVTLFWVLTGELPYPRPDSLAAALKAIKTTAPRRLRAVKPALPEALDELVGRMLRRNPAERPTAADVAAALSRFAAPVVLRAAEPPPGADAPEDQLRAAVARLEDLLAARNDVAAGAQGAVLTALAAMAQVRGEALGAQRRVSEYVRVLAGHLARHPNWPMLADPATVKELQRCAAARNLGLAAVPDAVLQKAGKLTDEELAWVQWHTVAGDTILGALATEHGAALPFLRTAREVARHHHEKWDGTGYPDRLAKDAIPPAARVVALADAYDALRRPGGNEPGLDHLETVDALFDNHPGFFDPVVLEAFKAVHFRFNEIYTTIPD